jgi:hypothetical protein
VKFYKYLSGEEKMPTNYTNPLSKTQIAYDKKKLEAIKKMKDLPVKEYNKKLWESQ